MGYTLTKKNGNWVGSKNIKYAYKESDWEKAMIHKDRISGGIHWNKKIRKYIVWKD